MKVLIIGCGYLGERVADLLSNEGHDVIGVTFSTTGAETLAARKKWRVYSADVTFLPSLQALRLKTGPVALFVHCASSSKGGPDAYAKVYRDGMQNLLQIYPEARPLFTSSTSVYSQADGSEVDEESPAEPSRETSQHLLAAEHAALSREGVVVRLAGLYGPGRSVILTNLLESKGSLEVTEEAPEGRWINQIHIQDAAAAISLLIRQRSKGVYNVVDDARTLQKAFIERLTSLFNLPLPPIREADRNRKRGWTHKRVSAEKLKALGWVPAFPSYWDAVFHDPTFISSLLAQVQADASGRDPRSSNIILIGLMGSGKSSVGRIVARLLGYEFVDTDHLISDQAGMSIPEIFAKEGEEGFRSRESSVLRSLLGKKKNVIATGGGIVTQAVNLPWLRHFGFITWLEASTELLARRTSSNQDRPLLRGEESPREKLARLIEQRAPLYKSLADLRIQTDELTQEESAYGVAESARHFFASRAVSS